MQSLARSLRIRPIKFLQVLQKRSNSNSTQPSVSPHVGFYKTFSRPIAKVLLMATFTYQVAYWGWVKLEKEEERAAKTEEISGLEGELQGLVEGKKTQSKP
ncbi:Inner membrane assembly complex subunit [Lachnellula suecica]|uniref:Inner membrane assembly complex subunit n=1 Tax=Lachnellula suecica TaxID=602035 RepID=A0A8T9C1M2_9HELO|nr:Inner membrane assembly complex subunit [Lachnellula suecica]